MAVSLREYRARIKSTESMKKITRAMELIAASRIIKAQQRAQAAAPYARELTRAVSAVATFSNVDHALTTEPEDPKRAAILIVTSDRGLAGAYSSSVLKEAERLVEKLKEEGKEVDLYITGRKGEAYFKFRQRPDRRRRGPGSPTSRRTTWPATSARRSSRRSSTRTTASWPRATRRVSTRCTWSTRGSARCWCRSRRRCGMLPLEVVEGTEVRRRDDLLPLYEFEPSPSDVLDSLLPRYVQSRIFFALLQAAASELAARQKAMKSATDNADELIKKYKRIANQARQAGITQEISEIVGGVNALADAQAGSE